MSVGEVRVAVEEKRLSCCGDRICVSGVNQLKRISVFLFIRKSRGAGKSQNMGAKWLSHGNEGKGNTYLVRPKCPIAMFKRRTISPPRGFDSSHEDRECATRNMRIVY